MNMCIYINIYTSYQLSEHPIWMNEMVTVFLLNNDFSYVPTFNITSKWSFIQWCQASFPASQRNHACKPEGRNVESKETTETSWRIYHIHIYLYEHLTSIHVMYMDTSFKAHLPFFQKQPLQVEHLSPPTIRKNSTSTSPFFREPPTQSLSQPKIPGCFFLVAAKLAIGINAANFQVLNPSCFLR